MKHSRVRPLFHDELKDLDRLVRAEIDAIQQESSRKRVKAGDSWQTGSRFPNVVQKILSPAARKTVPTLESSWGDEIPAQEDFSDAAARADWRRPLGELHSADEADHEAQQASHYEEDQGKSSGEAAEGLLSKEEEVFVRHVVQWLRPRKTKDIIWARVWSQLTEEQSEEFYSPEPEDSDALHEATQAHKADESALEPNEAPAGDPKDNSA